MDGQHVKLAKFEKQRSHVFSHMHKTHPKDNYIHKNMTIHIPMGRKCRQQWNYAMELRGGGKAKENDRESTTLKYFTSVMSST
jgi:hypothetical protein